MHNSLASSTGLDAMRQSHALVLHKLVCAHADVLELLGDEAGQALGIETDELLGIDIEPTELLAIEPGEALGIEPAELLGIEPRGVGATKRPHRSCGKSWPSCGHRPRTRPLRERADGILANLPLCRSCRTSRTAAPASWRIFSSSRRLFATSSSERVP